MEPKEFKPVKVVIGQCSYKGPDVHCYSRYQEFFHHLGRLQETSKTSTETPPFEFLTGNQAGNSLIGQARDNICEGALQAGADYVFFFDDDMIFDNDAFIRLWKRQKMIVGALAFTARIPIAPVLWKFTRTWNPERQCEDVKADVMLDYPKDQLFEVGCIGTGVILISTEVFRRIKKPWFHGAVGAGEDFHFCWQANRAGIAIYCDSSVKTAHRPNFPFEWHNEEAFLESPRSALRMPIA